MAVRRLFTNKSYLTVERVGGVECGIHGLCCRRVASVSGVGGGCCCWLVGVCGVCRGVAVGCCVIGSFVGGKVVMRGIWKRNLKKLKQLVEVAA